MLKKEVRKRFMQERDQITVGDKLKWDDLILIQLQTLELPFLDHVLSFYPIEQNNEINTFILTDYLHFRNPALRVCYPRTDLTRNTMQAVICGADTIFESNKLNIPEPTTGTVADPELLDLVIIPLVAFDKKGNRVGYGKGFYDQFLRLCHDNCIRMGVSYFEPVDSIEDANENDVPLDFCITPKSVYVF